MKHYWHEYKRCRNALRQVLKRLEGINFDDLSTAERQIIRIAREALEAKK